MLDILRHSYHETSSIKTRRSSIKWDIVLKDEIFGDPDALEGDEFARQKKEEILSFYGSMLLPLPIRPLDEHTLMVKRALRELLRDIQELEHDLQAGEVSAAANTKLNNVRFNHVRLHNRWEWEQRVGRKILSWLERVKLRCITTMRVLGLPSLSCSGDTLDVIIDRQFQFLQETAQKIIDTSAALSG